MNQLYTYKSCLVESAGTGAPARRYTVRPGGDAALGVWNVVQTLYVFLAKVVNFARNCGKSERKEL